MLRKPGGIREAGRDRWRGYWWFPSMVLGRGSGGGEGLRRWGWVGDQGSGHRSSGDGRMGCVAGRIVGICCNAGWVGYWMGHPIISVEHQGIESCEGMVRSLGHEWIFHQTWWDDGLFCFLVRLNHAIQHNPTTPAQ